ncbi:MAG: glycosyltransferase family 39 protein, partial [Saprospiraceae bacterium]
AGLSMNMAEGIGTFWNPKLSEVHHFSFHEHPPLVFGIQSLAFEVFGPSIVTERIYTVLVFILSALLLVLLWREVFRDNRSARRLWFIPLTIWLANEVVYHFYAANMLEPTMTLFTSGAVYLGLHANRSGTGFTYQLAAAALAGLCVFAATLCKGFVALFPLAFYVLHWLIYRNRPVLRPVLLTLVMVATLALAYLLLLQHPPAYEALKTYFDSQVMASLLSERSYEPHFRSSRFYIVEKAFLVLIPAMLIALITVLAGTRMTDIQRQISPYLRPALLFLGIGLAASLPLAVSLKQSFYYLLPSMNYFALGFAILTAAGAVPLFSRPMGKRWSQLLTGVMVLLLIAGLANTARHWGQVNRRDRVVLNDIDQMNTVLQPTAVIGSQGDIAGLVSYFYRTNRISIDTTAANVSGYEVMVAQKDTTFSGYQPVPLTTEKYGLYRRID